jgi:hypothetical protein
MTATMWNDSNLGRNEKEIRLAGPKKQVIDFCLFRNNDKTRTRVHIFDFKQKHIL